MARAKTCDFLVVGGGSAGFNAARTAAGLGLKTIVVDGVGKVSPGGKVSPEPWTQNASR